MFGGRPEHKVVEDETRRRVEEEEERSRKATESEGVFPSPVKKARGAVGVEDDDASSIRSAASRRLRGSRSWLKDKDKDSGDVLEGIADRTARTHAPLTVLLAP